MDIFKIQLILVYIYYLLVLVSCGSKADRKDWVDPSNMLRYDELNKKMRPVQIEKPRAESINLDDNKNLASRLSKEKETSQKVDCEADCDVQYLKRFTQQILNYLPFHSKYARLSEDDETHEMIFDVQISLTEKDYETLKNFLQTHKSRSMLNDIDRILSRLFSTASPRLFGGDLPVEPIWDRFYNNAHNFFYNKHVIVIGTFILALVIPVILLRFLTLRGFFLILFLLLLAVSFAMEYVFLLQEAEASQRFQQSQFTDIPKECQPSQLNSFESVTSFIKHQMFGMENKCEKYYKVMMIDPKFEITPTTVLSSMIGKVGIIAAKMFGESISIFYDKLVEGRSYLGAIVFLLFLILITVAILWVTCPTIMYHIPRLLSRPRREVTYGYAYGRQMIHNFPVEPTYLHPAHQLHQQLQSPNFQIPLPSSEFNEREEIPSTSHTSDSSITENTTEKCSRPAKKLSKSVGSTTSTGSSPKSESPSSDADIGSSKFDTESQREETLENLTSTKISAVVIYRECSTQT